MKILKVLAIGLAGLLILVAVGGYFFFKKAFTPDPNHLTLSDSSGFIPISWSRSKDSDIAALKLPIQLEGIPQTFYLQFDTGAPSSLLYKKSMLAIKEKYPDHVGNIDSTSKTIKQSFQLGTLNVHSDQLRLYERGEKTIDWNKDTEIKIGTLGADIIDKKLTVFDFVNQCIYFGEEVPNLYQDIAFHDMKFKLRKVLLPGVVAGKKGNLLHDSGASGFDLITNKKTWQKLSRKGAKPKEAFKVRSWKRTLTAYNIATDEVINFKPMDLNLNQVTYVKGTSFMQNAGMRLTGMGGMIGNQLFMGKILILDCKNRRYSIVD